MLWLLLLLFALINIVPPHLIIDPGTLDSQSFISLKTNIDDFRPVGLQFTPDGNDLYLTSIEKHQIRDITPTGVPLPNPEDWQFLNTGTVWKIIHI